MAIAQDSMVVASGMLSCCMKHGQIRKRYHKVKNLQREETRGKDKMYSVLLSFACSNLRNIHLQLIKISKTKHHTHLDTIIVFNMMAIDMNEYFFGVY